MPAPTPTFTSAPGFYTADGNEGVRRLWHVIYDGPERPDSDVPLVPGPWRDAQAAPTGPGTIAPLQLSLERNFATSDQGHGVRAVGWQVLWNGTAWVLGRNDGTGHYGIPRMVPGLRYTLTQIIESDTSAGGAVAHDPVLPAGFRFAVAGTADDNPEPALDHASYYDPRADWVDPYPGVPTLIVVGFYCTYDGPSLASADVLNALGDAQPSPKDPLDSSLAIYLIPGTITNVDDVTNGWLIQPAGDPGVWSTRSVDGTVPATMEPGPYTVVTIPYIDSLYVTPTLFSGLSYNANIQEAPVTTPVQDPNPPATQPDTTVNGGSDFYGDGGGAYVSPDDISTAHIAGGTKETSTPGGVSGGDDSLIGTDSGRTVNSLSTSGTDGTTASGAVVDTGLTETQDTTKAAYDRDGGANDPVYRAPSEMVYADNRDTTLTNFQSYVADDNDPNALPSGYAMSTWDTTGAHTAQGGAVAFTPPGAPQNVTAVAVDGRREIVVSWDAGTAPVGADVKRWVIEGNTLGTKYAPADARNVHIHEGLIGGDTYRFTIYAETDLGTGYRSAPSAPVTVNMDDIVVDTTYIESEDYSTAAAPGAPTAVVATPGAGGTASVAFTAPTEDGGDAISSYTATSAPGGFTASGGGSPLVVSGLTPGVDYTFTVTATNANGTSAASDPSAPVTATA